jgi:hypothetical protein
MLLFTALTVFFVVALSFASAYMQREEISKNWSKYRENPLYMFAAPLFKPDGDPRSRLKFASDNFTDVVNVYIMRVFKVFLQPVMKIVQLLTGSMEESLGGIMSMRGVLGNMYKKFSSVADIFQSRYNRTFQALRVTWVKLHESLKKTFGVAVSSLYAGVSAFRAIDNMFRLMTIVSIVILSILLGFVFFFFFILWPILPLILMAIAFVAQTPYAGEVTGMSSAFCFSGDTQVPTTNGAKQIKDIKIGDVLIHDGQENKVMGTLELSGEYEPLYNLFGVKVSGSHIYYDEGIPVFVKDMPDAWPYAEKTAAVYCLITENNTIPVISNSGIIIFADWEEISGDDLNDWHKTVFDMLNPSASYNAPTVANLNSEAALSEQSLIFTPLGPVEIRTLTPGTKVYSHDGKITDVLGIVRIHPDEIAAVKQLDSHTFISAGAWLYEKEVWSQPVVIEAPPKEVAWFQLFTASGTFRVLTSDFKDIPIRDFSDVGSEMIDKTYDMVLDALLRKIQTQ